VLVNARVAGHVLGLLLVVMALVPAKHLVEEAKLGLRGADEGEEGERKREEAHFRSSLSDSSKDLPKRFWAVLRVFEARV
jgi:hypothetical protein